MTEYDRFQNIQQAAVATALNGIYSSRWLRSVKVPLVKHEPKQEPKQLKRKTTCGYSKARKRPRVETPPPCVHIHDWSASVGPAIPHTYADAYAPFITFTLEYDKPSITSDGYTTSQSMSLKWDGECPPLINPRIYEGLGRTLIDLGELNDEDIWLIW